MDSCNRLDSCVLGPHHTMQLSRDRVIAHVDLDCFYVQVEVQRNEKLAGLPVAVVQYDPYSNLKDLDASSTSRLKSLEEKVGNSIIALSYEAKACGVTRTMSGIKARALCPNLQLIQVPVAHGKADLTIYREAGDKVAKILASRAICEKASIDEVYLDVTEEASRLLSLTTPAPPPQPDSLQGVHLICPAHQQESPMKSAMDWWSRSGEWCPHERLLAAGAAVVWKLRKRVLDELGFTTSAGVSHYKILAKLGSGLNKPAQQTIVPAAAVLDLLRDLPLAKLRGLGGHFGQEVQEKLAIKTAGELSSVPVARSEAIWGREKAVWLQRLAHGVDSADGGITPRLQPKSISCGKTFRGQNSLTNSTLHKLRYWLGELGKELEERGDEDKRTNRRIPQLLTVAFDFRVDEGEPDRVSRSCPLKGQGCQAAAMADHAMTLIRKWAAEKPPRWSIHSMSMGVSNFIEAPPAARAITRFFSVAQPSSSAAAPAAAPSHTSVQQDVGLVNDTRKAPLDQHRSACAQRASAICLGQAAWTGGPVACGMHEEQLQQELHPPIPQQLTCLEQHPSPRQAMQLYMQEQRQQQQKCQDYVSHQQHCPMHQEHQQQLEEQLQGEQQQDEQQQDEQQQGQQQQGQQQQGQQQQGEQQQGAEQEGEQQQGKQQQGEQQQGKQQQGEQQQGKEQEGEQQQGKQQQGEQQQGKQHPGLQRVDLQSRLSQTSASFGVLQQGWKRLRGAEVDCQVLAELPADLQRELQASLIIPSHPSSQALHSTSQGRVAKRGRGQGRDGGGPAHARSRSSRGGGFGARKPPASKDLLSYFVQQPGGKS